MIYTTDSRNWPEAVYMYVSTERRAIPNQLVPWSMTRQVDLCDKHNYILYIYLGGMIHSN